MEKTPYDKDHASHYDASRNMPPEMQEAWLTTARKYLPHKDGARIIDIGSGTGRFAELFVKLPNSHITGVEPSEEMRKVAETKKSSDRIRYLKGSAESLPITNERFDLAWISMVIHHVDNRTACASEAARVLNKGGFAIVRNTFSGRLEGIELYEYFTGTAEIDNNRLPSVDEVRQPFEAAGLSFVALESVQQIFAVDFPAYIEKMRNRGTSTLRLISDEEFQKGLSRLEEIQRSGKRSGPVTEFIDMLVFRKN